MDGFSGTITKLLMQTGINEKEIHQRVSVELPGFFRPTKEWDIVVVADGNLVAAIELKSQIGPSFGNNFNNRTEEALGTAMDIWTAYREGAFSTSPAPWLGYLLLLEDCPESRRPVSVREPHFLYFRSLSTRHTANAMSYSAESWCERDNTIRCVSSPLTEKTLI